MKTAITELDDNYANLVDNDFVTWPPFQLQISQVTDPIHAVAPKVLFTAFCKWTASHREALHIARIKPHAD